MIWCVLTQNFDIDNFIGHNSTNQKRDMAGWSSLNSHNFTNEILVNVFKACLKNFLIGMGISSILSLYNFLSNLSKNKKKEGMLQKYISHGVRFGSFLASWSLFYQLLIRVMDSNVSSPHSWSLLVSGSLSGFASMYLTQGMSWTVSLYFLIRSLASWYRIKSEKFPQYAINIHPVLVYALLNVYLGYVSQLGSAYMDSTYGAFLEHCSGTKANEFALMWGNKILPPCYPVFHREETCYEAAKVRNWTIFKRISNIYVPFYFLSIFLRGGFFVKGWEKQKSVWTRFLTGTSRSTLFLFVQCMICGPGPCIHKLFSNNYKIWSHAINWFVGSLAIVLEAPSRTREINLFTSWKLLHATINYVFNVKEHFGEQHSERLKFWASNIFFALASFVSMYCLVRNRKELKSLDRTILVSLFPESIMK
jgi:hypothetical protein